MNLSHSSSIQMSIKQLCSVAERWIIGRQFLYTRNLHCHAVSEKRREIKEKLAEKEEEGGWGMISLSLHHLSDNRYFSSFHLKPWCRAFSQQFSNNLISIHDFLFPSKWWTTWAFVIKICSQAMLNSLQYHLLAVWRQGKVIKLSYGSPPRRGGGRQSEAAEGKTIYISVLHLLSQEEVHLVGFSSMSFSRLWLYWKHLPAGEKKKPQ